MLHTLQNDFLPMDYSALDLSFTWYPFVQAWTEVDGFSLDFTSGLVTPWIDIPLMDLLKTMITYSLD